MALFKKNEVYTIEEAAKRLRVHTNTIYKLCRSGAIDAYRSSDAPKGPWRIPGSGLEKLHWGPGKPGRKTQQEGGAE